MRIAGALSLGLGAIILSSPTNGAQAQAAPASLPSYCVQNPATPLCTFVTQQNSTPLQQAAAAAVQGTCRFMATHLQLVTLGPVADLFGRCSALVQTAAFRNGKPINGSTGLGITSDDLLSGLVQVSGNELSSQGTLVTQ